MFGEDQDFFTTLNCYQEDPDKTYLKLPSADPSFGFQGGDILQISMQEDLNFNRDVLGHESTDLDYSGLTDLGDTGLALTEFVDPMLRGLDSSPLQELDITNSTDLDLGLQYGDQYDALDMSGLTLEEDKLDFGDVLGMGVCTAQPAAATRQPSPPRQSRRRSARAAAANARAMMAQVLQDAPDPESDLATQYSDPAAQYPPLSALGLPEEAGRRQRAPRVSYDTLTPEQRHQRVRELNNEASRVYRQKKVEKIKTLQQQELQLQAKQQQLLRQCQGLQQLKDNWTRLKGDYDNYVSQLPYGAAMPR